MMRPSRNFPAIIVSDMLKFLFRRDSNAPVTSRASDSPSRPDESAKQLALLQAGNLAQDEAIAVAFIVECGYADARLLAAQHVVSKPMLEQVLQAMRKTDRRVAKLMQARLDDLRHGESSARHAQDCIAEAQRLLQESPLMANLVADLDRCWQLVGAAPAPLREIFDLLRQQIAARLAAQAALQRSVIDVLERMRKLDETLPEEMLARLEAEMAQHRASPEVASLPLHLLPEFERERERLNGLLVMRQRQLAALGAREEALVAWEAVDPAMLDHQALRRAWNDLPPIDEAEALALLQQRFDALQQLAPQRVAKLPPAVAAASDVDFQGALTALEQALQDGSLHAASEQDEILRAMDLSACCLNVRQQAQLADARAELKRLQGWAKWGGNVSREELIDVVGKLATPSLSLKDLAKMVGVVRQQWKTLDIASGAAPKTLWERFDAACNAAYAPVAEQAKMQSLERQQNRDKAESLLAGLRSFAEVGFGSGVADGAPDWKKVANQYRVAQQSWQRLGPMDRKDRKRLDAEFGDILQRLQAPLQEQWQQEIARRENLITEVQGLNPDDRATADRVRQIQVRWQESARALPLERQDEQPLWQRFRSACDAVFAHRRESAGAAYAQRQQQAQEKAALCTTLEAALDQPEVVIRKLLRETEEAWTRSGQLARTDERQTIQRYRNAVAALRARLDAARQAAQEAQLRALQEKLSLCQAAEAAVAANLVLDAGWAAHWQMLPPLASKWEALMRARFDDAHAALQAGDRDYALRLERDSNLLAQGLLRLEVVAGIASPPELSRERLQMQVDVLQSAFSGQGRDAQTMQLEQLCGLAALTDEQSAERLCQLLEKIWHA